ncbi:Importin alpha re-exporter [Spathaspora sp. JA1]|nr:Importin alpha re-exporter [Spathaspora sp. JA1]
MADNSLESITAYLEQSLSPQYAKEAEKLLRSIESQPGFAINLLHIIASTNISHSIRLAGAVFLKNLVRRKWIDEDGTNYLLPIEDVTAIKTEIIDVMIKLPSNLQAQLGETISLIAESDFPHNWSNLIDDLVRKFSMSDFVNNKAILLVAHSIFKKWRPLFGSNELYAEIQLVLDKFAPTFLQLVIELDRLIDSSQDNKAQLDIYFDNLLLLMQIYYDFNSQEIPEFFEDNMIQLMNIVHKYLIYTNPLLIDSEDDGEIEVLIKVKTSIIELISLYVVRYADVFEPLIETFITSVWELVNSFVTKQSKYDLLVVKSLQFLTDIIKIENYQNIFQTESSINEIIEKIILPNIYFRENDQEIFEDDPLHFIRSDLEGSDFDSRRKSSTDFLRELKELNRELLTSSVMKYVQQFLTQTPPDWRNKDTAIYLFSSLATKGSITTIGVTSTNTLVDVVEFFTNNVAQDLIDSTTHPILQVDAIKYIFTFRNQLTKDQLLGVLPQLITHLNGKFNPVVYTYSAITIEKLLTMTDFNTQEQIINKTDIKPYINQMLNELFQLILMNNSSPEKLAENEFLMKCLVSILNTAEETLTEGKTSIINQLLQILQITSKNPSNPKFSHYIFESLGFLIKYGNKEEIPTYMDLIIPNLLEILGEDVQEFVPYTLQILAFLLENYSGPIPNTFVNLIEPLLSPTVWAYKGNIPGITRLLISIINHDHTVFDSNLLPLLGVFQKLIASKINDGYGFDLLESILLNIQIEKLQPHLNVIITLLLRRLSDSRTDKFVKRFVVFLTGLAVIPANTKFPNSNVINGDFVVQLFDSIQAGIFQQIYQSFILTYSNKISNLQDKKIINIGLSYFITCSIFQSTYANLVPVTIEQLMSNLNEYSTVSKDGTGSTGAGAATAAGGTTSIAPLSELDLNLSSFGSHFSKIVAINIGKFDPLDQIKNNDYESIKLIIGENLKKVPASFLNLVSNESHALLKGILR